jgi:hypothetical protein
MVKGSAAAAGETKMHEKIKTDNMINIAVLNKFPFIK